MASTVAALELVIGAVPIRGPPWHTGEVAVNNTMRAAVVGAVIVAALALPTAAQAEPGKSSQ